MSACDEGYRAALLRVILDAAHDPRLPRSVVFDTLSDCVGWGVLVEDLTEDLFGLLHAAADLRPLAEALLDELRGVPDVDAIAPFDGTLSEHLKPGETEHDWLLREDVIPFLESWRDTLLRPTAERPKKTDGGCRRARPSAFLAAPFEDGSRSTALDDAEAMTLEGLRSAVMAFGKAEMPKLVQRVIADLKDIDASGIFGDGYLYQTLWDELCHEVQEGPYDDELGGPFGSVSRAMEASIAPSVEVLVDELPKHFGPILTAYALFEQDDHDMQPEIIGFFSPDALLVAILDQVRERAGLRLIRHFGPWRVDYLRNYEPVSDSTVWGLLCQVSPEVADELLYKHAAALITGGDAFEMFAVGIVEALLSAAQEDEEEGAAALLLRAKGEDMRDSLVETDAKPFLERWRMAVEQSDAR